jgi:hypothetical protein
MAGYEPMPPHVAGPRTVSTIALDSHTHLLLNLRNLKFVLLNILLDSLLSACLRAGPRMVSDLTMVHQLPAVAN